MQKIAFLGLGHMGAPMARRLLAAGYPLTVWNRTPQRAGPLVAEGAVPAGSPAQAVRDADVVLTMLAGPDALAAVAEDVVPQLRPGVVWVEMSTVGPDAVRELAGRLKDGTVLVDAPVTGSTDRAAAGTLGILAGGDTTGVEQILARLGSVTRTGPSGSGAALKLVLNTALIGGVGIVAESLRLADALGVDGETAREALAAGPLGGAVGRAFADGVLFANDLAAKDLRIATGVTRLPVTEALLDHFGPIADDPAPARADLARAVTLIREGHR
ncbi:NAD(P)-dependent oxidoreductase [Streptomyces monashensis]|uniref:NAD(P)-dependent oxidoreductase n=1 Tax=Streptomyces monashensis TaxID=1678012 RepID=UPI0033EF2DCA